MRIAFITNYEKTIFFHAVSQCLEAAGHDVYWISPSHHWAGWLTQKGVRSARVLDLTAFGQEWKRGQPTPEQVLELRELEDQSGLGINDVMLMDRILRDKSHSYVLAYFAVARRQISRFLREQDISIVFGEQAFGVEILVGMICKTMGLQMLVPHPVRIPARRNAFFQGHLQAKLASIREVNEEDRQKARAFHAHFRENRPRPHYFYRNNKRPSLKSEWLAKLVKHIRLSRRDPFDETHFSPMWLMRTRLREVFNALIHRVTKPFAVPSLPPRRPFVLFTLHKQPEASIDVLGSYYCNQLELLRALARSLPVTHDLYVKEHSNALGDRSWSYLRSIRRIPGVLLIDPGVDAFALLEAADLVVTVSGTIAYEAALLGKPAVTASSMFFGPLLRVNGFNPYAQRLADLIDSDGFKAGDDQIVEFLAWIHAQSFPGIINNPIFEPECLAMENIESVALGFLELLKTQEAEMSIRQ